MPNRILKESICTSENIQKLMPDEEVFFYRLLVNCDDYGRLDGRLSVIRSRLYPLKVDEIKDDDISAWCLKLQDAELIKVYTIENHPYIQISKWEEHQQIRAKKSKYPAPNGNGHHTFDNNCYQPIADDNKCPRNPIQSNIESNPNPTPETDFAAIFSKYEDLTGGKVNNMDVDRIKLLIEEYSSEWILLAIEQANKMNHRNLSYVEGILRNSKSKGIKPGTPKPASKPKSLYPELPKPPKEEQS